MWDLWLATGAVAILVLLLCVLVLRRWWRSLRARVRARRYLLGEAKAERLLVRRGYEIEERQCTTAWSLLVDGEEFDVRLRADLIVALAGRRYVAEVKTGKSAPNVTNVSTRRQLLEYRVAYDVDGVLLVNPEAKQILEIDFVAFDNEKGPLPARSDP